MKTFKALKSKCFTEICLEMLDSDLYYLWYLCTTVVGEKTPTLTVAFMILIKLNVVFIFFQSLQTEKTCYSSFSIIRYFLSNPGRILSALIEKSKIENCPLWGLNPQPLDHQSNALPNWAKSLFGCLCESLRPLRSQLYWFQK